MKAKRTLAVFKKQIFDTISNSSVLLQFVMYPILALILTKTIAESNANLSQDFFIVMFSSMYVGMSPVVAIEGIISEEKEKGSLRSLLMNNVKPMEYLTGVGLYTFIACLIGTSIFAIGSTYTPHELRNYYVIMCLGIVCAMLLGATIGIKSKNQMSSHSIAIPISMVLAFMPLISTFNEKFEKFSKYLYSQQVHNIISNLDKTSIGRETIFILLANMIVLLLVFVYTYSKKSIYDN